MVSANKSVAVEFSLAEQRALMGAAASEGAPPAAGPRQDDVHPVRGERKRTCALEFAEIGDAKECFGLHDQTLTGRQPHTLPRRIFAVNPAVPERFAQGGAISPTAIGDQYPGMRRLDPEAVGPVISFQPAATILLAPAQDPPQIARPTMTTVGGVAARRRPESYALSPGGGKIARSRRQLHAVAGTARTQVRPAWAHAHRQDEPSRPWTMAVLDERPLLRLNR